MQQTIIYPKYIDAVKYAVDKFSAVLEGKGRVTGRQFSRLIEKNCNTTNPITQDAVGLTREYIDNIEKLDSGAIRWQIK